MKLAEIFLASNEEASFSQQETDLQALGDADALAKLDELKAKYADSMASEPSASESLQPEMPQDAVEIEQNDELEDLEFELPELDVDAKDESDVSAAFEDNVVKFTADSGDDFFDIDAGDSDEDNLLEFSLDETQQSSGDNADDMDFLIDTDESSTKLELAKAYIDMADAEAAQEILNEVVSEGSDEQQYEAKKLLDNLV